LDNLKFRALSPIHWIRGHPSLLKLKSLIPNLSSAKCLVIFPSIKDNKQAIHIQCLKTKKIRKSIWKPMKRDRAPSLILWNMKLVLGHIKFRQTSQQNLRVTSSMCLYLTHSRQIIFFHSLSKSCQKNISNKQSFLRLKMKRTPQLVAQRTMAAVIQRYIIRMNKIKSKVEIRWHWARILWVKKWIIKRKRRSKWKAPFN